ncbi:PP2C family protein-serine/threonine phosphatase [Micromonospora wenchangensis]|uniref:PP2C family protein-serine/threonine phosphatase n=1 Tax=Micromonospora wenchangensis TaxID=1185415 RepID=UPI0037F199A0
MGLVRQRNEDAAYLGEFLVAVADGLGGHVAGDVASSTAIEAVRQYDRMVDPSALPAVLGQAVNAANRALRRRIETEPGLAGMGTTLVAMLRAGATVALANVGDSRAYLLQSGQQHGQTTQITEDHLYKHLVAEAASVPNLPDRLARFLDGRQDGRAPDITLLTLIPGDRLLLCTDGLSSYVPHDLLHSALATSATAQEAVDRLIASALAQGGLDNVTVTVIFVGPAPA